MSLFFFDIHDGRSLVLDEFGIDLCSLREARDQAVALLPDIVRDEVPDGEARDVLAIVRDERGRPVYRARLLFRGEWLSSEPARLD